MSDDHIIESIDSALHDWETSDDAMRWVPPEAEERRALLEPRHRFSVHVDESDPSVIRRGPDSFWIVPRGPARVQMAPVGTEPLGEGWQDVGYIDEDSLSFGAATPVPVWQDGDNPFIRRCVPPTER